MEKIGENDLPAVLIIADIQQFLGIGRQQAYNLAQSGQFHVVKVGRLYRIDRDVFLAWFKGVENEEKTR